MLIKSTITLIVMILTMISPSFGEQKRIALNKEYILNNFPLCSVRSSVGQKCKSLTESQRAAFSIKDLAEKSKPYSNDENIIIIEDETWYYSFSLDLSDKHNPVISFTDDANLGTYYTSVSYNLMYSEEQQNWFLISKIVNFLDGSEEDKQIEGKLFKITPPIPFIKSKND